MIPILRKYPVNKAILFGSFAKERANNSDIDLYIDTNGKLNKIQKQESIAMKYHPDLNNAYEVLSNKQKRNL